MTPKTLNLDHATSTTIEWALKSPGDINLGAGGLSNGACRMLARTPPVAGIIRTRTNQQAEWHKPQEDEFSVGAKITMRDPNEKMSATMAREADKAMEAWMEGGRDFFPGGVEGVGRALSVDSLIGDLAFLEIGAYKPKYIPSSKEELLWFKPVDPIGMRREITDEQVRSRKWYAQDDGRVAFTQWMDNEEVARLTAKEIYMCIRNPRSWDFVGGYGHPELEELVSIVSWVIHAMVSNGSQYMTGLHGNVLIVLKSAMKSGRFEQVERIIHAALSGAVSNRKTPVVQISSTLNEAIEAIDLRKNNNADMQYSDWINFLVKVICALYAMDPAEMGFLYGSEGVKNQQYANSPLDRIVNSKERGLRPFVRAMARWYDEAIFKRFWPRLKFQFVGFDAQSQKDRDEAEAKALGLYLTPNEVRARHNLPRIDHPAADLPLHNAFTLQESLQPPAIIEPDTVSAWLNGTRQQRRPFAQAA